MLSDFKLAVNWITKLGKAAGDHRKAQVDAINALDKELLVRPLDLASLFIEPDCQQYPPIDHRDDEEEVSDFRGPVFSTIEKFIRKKNTNKDGSNHLFILADAGMGKTSLLAMFKLAHIQGFWPQKLQCEAFKLGPDTLDQLKSLDGPGSTILLLDSLDEDPTAQGRFEERLLEIMQVTKNFARVIITCRNQFFPEGKDNVFGQPDKVKIGPFSSRVVYLSLFSDEQVQAYLKRKFPTSWFEKVLRKDNPKLSDAQAVIKTMDSLRFRPMLLSYIDSFLEAGSIKGKNILEVFEILVDKWLDREIEKGFVKEKEPLLEACKALAYKMVDEDKRVLTQAEIAAWNGANPRLPRFSSMEIEGRSLLTRNSERSFQFSHYSLQEYFYFLNGAFCDIHKSGALVKSFVLIKMHKIYISRKPFYYSTNIVSADELQNFISLELPKQIEVQILFF